MIAAKLAQEVSGCGECNEYKFHYLRPDILMVSCIIVNWNGKELLADCLRSVERQTYRAFEIILVDNGSTDCSVGFVESEFPFVKIISLTENRGFAGGNIEGLRHAQGEFIALLNNDVRLSERWIENMITAISQTADIGLCSSKLIIEGTNEIDSIGEIYTTAFTSLKLGEHRNGSEFETEKFVPGACAAAVFYRKAMIDKIGFFDATFFLNYEDSDLHMRAWFAGWKCVFVPEAVAYHKVSATLGNLSDSAVYYLSRNVEWVWVKNVPFQLMLRYLHHRILAELVTFVYLCFIKHKWRPFFRGKIDALRKMHIMISQRKSVQGLIRLSNEQIKQELLPISQYLKIRFRNLITEGK